MVFLSERKLILDQGLPGRPWYKHALYAPGVLTGYDVKVMPGIREAIENEDWGMAQEQIDIMGSILTRYSDFLDQIVESAE